MNWFPIFYREILLFRRRLLRLGYVVSALVSPMLYLLAFGLGLGKRVAMSAGAPIWTILLPGLIAMTSMTNSYTWIATSMTVGRLHFRTFQVYIQSPVTAADIVVGQILAGMVRGLFASIILLGSGPVSRDRLSLQPDVHPGPDPQLPGVRRFWGDRGDEVPVP